MTGMVALAFGGMMISCSQDIENTGGAQQKFQQTYEEAFTTRFGQPSKTQDWGFGDNVKVGTRGMTRSMAEPACADITAPYDEDWVATYNETAKEPNSENVGDNYDNSVYHEGTPGTATYKWNWDVMNAAGYDAWGPVFTQFSWGDYTNASEEIYNYLKEQGNEDWVNVETTPGTEGYWEYDETFVLNFKITGTYSGGISVAATEGLTNGVESGNQRTIVVTGTWNITENQRIGSLGKIIIANGGTVNVASGKTLEMVNQARLVVLSGGTLTGEGSVTVNNGNAVGEENYNAGTIDVATFNNNFGKFYNYGQFLVNEYQGGAQESNFYNHSLVAIDHTSSTANARIFNGCQFYVKNDARLRNYEGVGGSALIVDGQLLFSGSEDGTSDPTYVGLAAGALVQCGSLYNNGTSWTGPTSGGYAALEIVNQIDHLNWVQDSPQTAGYFANNIYVKCGTWQNDPEGQGKHEDVDDGSEWGHINYTESRAEYKFWSVAANCTGNGNVTKVEDGNYEVIPADADFVKGEAGCTPGFKIKEEEDPVDPVDPVNPTTRTETESLRVIAEDLTVDTNTDFDFNDVVFDVIWTKNYTDEELTSQSVKVVLQAAGGTLPLYVARHEVHAEYGEDVSVMINTGAKAKGYRGNDAAGTREIALTSDQWSGSSIGAIANSIEVYVIKNNVNCYLSAPVGGIASKIGVKTNFEWCEEREDIDHKYSLTDGTSLFTEWVKGIYPANDWYEYAKRSIDDYKAAQAALNAE